MSQLRLPTELLPLDGRFGAGPSLVRPAQLDHLLRHSTRILGTSHRQPGVKQLVAHIQEQLGELFAIPSGYEVVLANGGSTAFWDAAAFGLIEHRSAHGSFGEFGGKFAAAAAAPWLAAPAVFSAPAGEVALPEPTPDADVYAWPHNETSTGALAPVQRIGAGTGALTVVDATSAAGGVQVDIAQTDVYYFAPQKNFGSDGGLWLAILSPAAVERVERIGASGRYIPEFLKLTTVLENSRKQQTLNTPAIGTLLLLEAQLAWILERGGLSWAAARTAQSSRTVYEWAEQRPYTAPFVADPAHRSPVVVTVDFEQRVDAAAVAASLRANWVVDVEPYRKLGRNQLRIATFVSVDPEDVVRLTRAIDYLVERLPAA